jgi:hypothetical protein
MLEIFNSLLFLVIGYLLGRWHNERKLVEEAIKQVKKQTNIVRPGVIEYPTQADIDYVDSGEEKVDEARLRLFKEQFKP